MANIMSIIGDVICTGLTILIPLVLPRLAEKKRMVKKTRMRNAELFSKVANGEIIISIGFLFFVTLLCLWRFPTATMENIKEGYLVLWGLGGCIPIVLYCLILLRKNKVSGASIVYVCFMAIMLHLVFLLNAAGVSAYGNYIVLWVLVFLCLIAQASRIVYKEAANDVTCEVYVEGKEEPYMGIDEPQVQKNFMRITSQKELGKQVIIDIPLKDVKRTKMISIDIDENYLRDNMQNDTGEKKMTKKKDKVAFINMCNQLKDKSRESKNNDNPASEYELAKAEVAEYIRNNENKLLQLKAEARRENFFDYQAYNISVIALVIGCYTLLFTIIEKLISAFLSLYGIGILVILIIAAIFVYYFEVRYKHIRKWRPYIQVAIEDFEQYHTEHKELDYKSAVEEWENKDKEKTDKK